MYIRSDDRLTKIVPNDKVWKNVIVNQTTRVVIVNQTAGVIKSAAGEAKPSAATPAAG